jgi:hypothetical protein
MSPQKPREPGADKSQQPKEGAAHPSGQGPSQAGPDYSAYPYGPGPQAGYGGWPYGRPPFGPPFGAYGPPPPGYGQQQRGGPYGPPPFGMPFVPQQCFMPPGMPPFAMAPFQWFWSWLMPWWWSWLMSWWVWPGGVWQLPPFPNPAQYDMTMQFAATRADFWRNSFEAAGRVAQQAANASRFPVAPWWPMPPAGPGYYPAMPDGAAQRPATPEINMQELGEALKSMRDPEQAQRVRYAVILMQQAEQMYRRGRPQAGGEDWR